MYQSESDKRNSMILDSLHVETVPVPTPGDTRDPSGNSSVMGNDHLIPKAWLGTRNRLG